MCGSDCFAATGGVKLVCDAFEVLLDDVVDLLGVLGIGGRVLGGVSSDARGGLLDSALLRCGSGIALRGASGTGDSNVCTLADPCWVTGDCGVGGVAGVSDSETRWPLMGRAGSGGGTSAGVEMGASSGGLLGGNRGGVFAMREV